MRTDPVFASLDPTDPPRWWVCHTKPRCEKKFADLLKIEAFEHYLPLVNSVRQYGSRVRTFAKPLFPSYVFARIPPSRKNRIYQRDYLVRVIPVDDEEKFLRQLDAVRVIVASGLETSLHPLLIKGTPVRIVAGPLRGVEALVEDPASPAGVVVAMDVLQQGVLVKVPMEHLKILT